MVAGLPKKRIKAWASVFRCPCFCMFKKNGPYLKYCNYHEKGRFFGMRKMIVILLLGTLIGGGVLAYLYVTDNETSELDSLQNRVLHTEQVIVTLQDSSYLQMTVSIEVDSPDTKQRLEDSYPLIENAMIHSLSQFNRNGIQRENGVALMESALLEEFQQLLEEGEVKQVYVTEKVLQ